MIRTFTASAIACLLFPAVIAAGEPAPLDRTAEDRLEGQVRIGVRSFAVRLEDRNRNGAFDDPEDRLFIDLDGDGSFHPIKERFAVTQDLRLRGIGATEQHELVLLRTPWRIQIIPIEGHGYVRALLSEPADSDSSAELTSVSATLASQGGLHRQIDTLDEDTRLPAGRYRIENLKLEFAGERKWSIAFTNFNSRLDYTIAVRPDEKTSFELLGGLTLSALLLDRSEGEKGSLTIQPKLISESGLTLVRSLSGPQAARHENQLIAVLLSGDEDDPQPLDTKGSGFACGQFCPIDFKPPPGKQSDPAILLQFDYGPLGGPQFTILDVKSLQSP